LPPISYSATFPSNAVSALQARLDAGTNALHGGGDRETLARCLSALDVPVESQALVFSKTSLQRNLIHPRNPRAVYFSDDCYVGWVPGGLMEVTVTDPRLGLVFYRYDPRSTATSARFERDAECLSCHAGSRTRDWPGLMVRSVFPDDRGEPISSAGGFLTGHESPLTERWGGWYVTGSHGAVRSMGNSLARETAAGADLDREAGANLTDLGRFFPTDRYLRPDSDVVALMVLEHQVMMHNRLVEGGLRVRRWTHYQRLLQEELGQLVSAEPSGTARRVVESEAERILDYLLFRGEAALPQGGVRGSPAFPEAFRRNRRIDGAGRSLKDLDLETRLFTHRCSYMIHSQAFDILPVGLKQRIYQRLDQVLTGADSTGRFRYLEAEERAAIREILLATQPGIDQAWIVSSRPNREHQPNPSR
jgi:hypothetical protein